jgi:hypothetical protein
LTYTDQNPPTSLGERYARATITDDITVSADDRTDADKLLAAGFAAMGNVRGQMALALYRLDLNHVATRGEIRLLLETSASELCARSQRAGRWKLRVSTAFEIAETVVRWWVDSTCSACNGRKVDLIPGTQLTSARPCQACQGFGKAPVETRLPFKRQEAGRWLADDYRSMLGFVFGEMAARLANTLDLPDLSEHPALQQRLTELRSPAANVD